MLKQVQHDGVNMRKLALLPVLATLCLLAACATPETQIRTALTDSGLSKPMSGCMSKRMARELSLGQLLKLRSLGSLKGQKLGSLTIGEYLRRARALGDPEILKIVTSAGIGCSLTA
jgi:hypothetical protein